MAGYWIAFGDIHDDLGHLDRIPELPGALGVIVTGDVTFAGGAAQAAKVLEPIAARVPALYAQIGNMDRPAVNDWLEDKGWNLHARARALFPGVYAIGAGGSTPTPFNTPSEFSEEHIAMCLEQALAEARRDNQGVAPVLALISHSPPRDSACDRLQSGASAGSTAVRAFIEQYSPALCLCGHIHESRASGHIGRTLVINPGPLAGGGYVLLRRDGDSLTAELKSVQGPR